MTTIANVKIADSAHWYYADGQPCYELPKKDGSGMKVPTLADARKLNLLPSVTTILKVLNKPQLNAWLQEQAILAVLTTPRLPDEPLEKFVERVLQIEVQQDQEAQKARDFGTRIHAALELALQGQSFDESLRPFVAPALKAALDLGAVKAVEQIVCGSGVMGLAYAGKLDLQLDSSMPAVVDFKTTGKLPKESYPEHQLQLAAYAKALPDEPILTVNIYISTKEPGQIAICKNTDWHDTFTQGFLPLLCYWQWATGYQPAQEKGSA